MRAIIIEDKDGDALVDKLPLKYFIDPDFRRAPPPGDVPYCARCFKPIVDTAKAIAVTLDHDGLNVIMVGGSSYIGLECWRKIKRESHAR